jgi:D-glucuronyl C5-epimerase C-terminus
MEPSRSRPAYRRILSVALAFGLLGTSVGIAAAGQPTVVASCSSRASCAGPSPTAGRNQLVTGSLNLSLVGTVALLPAVPLLPAYFRNWQPNPAALTDAQGVVIDDYGGTIGTQYQPTAIAEAALAYYDRWLVDSDPTVKASDRSAFLIQVHWLISNQTPDGRWLFHFKWGKQQVPWWSAMTEGLAMSALLRSFALTRDPACFAALTRARTTFERDLNHNGVAAQVILGRTTYVVYQEYLPGYVSNVLNGWVFSMVGLYEAATYLHDPAASADLWGPRRGIAALKALLPYYDTGDWSRYDLRNPGTTATGDLASVTYHTLVIGQLGYIAGISGDSYFSTYAARFAADLTACQAARKCPPTR